MAQIAFNIHGCVKTPNMSIGTVFMHFKLLGYFQLIYQLNKQMS